MHSSSYFYIISKYIFINKQIIQNKIGLYLTKFMHINQINTLFRGVTIGNYAFLIYFYIYIFFNNILSSSPIILY